MKFIACILFVLLFMNAPAGGASGPAVQKALTGHVKKEQVRIARPGLPLNASTVNTTLTPRVQSTDFALNSSAEGTATGATSEKSQPLGAAIDELGSKPLQPVRPLVSKPMIEPSLSSGTAGGGVGGGGGGGGSGAPANYDYGAKPKVDYKTMVIRLKRFRSNNEMEIAWEATRMANRWLKKGARVIFLCDLEAVRMADMNDTSFSWFEKNRGNGNETAEKLTTPQEHLRQFVGAGGRLVVASRWVKYLYIANRALVPGAELATEEEIDDILMDPNAQIIDY